MFRKTRTTEPTEPTTEDTMPDLIPITALHHELTAENVDASTTRADLITALSGHLTTDAAGRSAVPVELAAEVLAEHRDAAAEAAAERAENARVAAAERSARQEAMRNRPSSLRARLRAAEAVVEGLENDLAMSRTYLASGGSDYDPAAGDKLAIERHFVDVIAPAELATARAEISECRERLAAQGASERPPVRETDAMATRGAGWDA